MVEIAYNHAFMTIIFDVCVLAPLRFVFYACFI
jgi:hypothetical protein